MQFLTYIYNLVEHHLIYQILLCALVSAIIGWRFRNETTWSAPPEHQTSTDSGFAEIFPWIFWIGLIVFIGWLN